MGPLANSPSDLLARDKERADPSDLEAEFVRAVACHQGGRIEEAERIYCCILNVAERHADCLHQLGVIATQRGLYPKGIDFFRKAIAIRGGSAVYYSNLAIALRYAGRPLEAMKSLHKAVALEPEYSPAHNHLGTVLWELGRFEEAEECFRTAVRLSPDYGEAHSNLGNLLRESSRAHEAVEQYRRALEVTPLNDPKTAIYNCNLGAMLREVGQLSAALESFRRALRVGPNDANIHYYIGLTLRDLGRLEEAELSFRRALVLDPSNPKASSDLGVTLRDLGQLDPAETYFRRAIHLDPNRADAYCGLGTVLMELGRLTEAEHYLECAVNREPKNALYHYNLSAVKRYSKCDLAFGLLESQLKKPDGRSTQEQIYLRFALAKAFEDVGEMGAAFEHLIIGNSIKRSITTYDESGTLERMERIAEVFTIEYMRTRGVGFAPAAGPIFIVGMLRSGSTLVEQILASHSQVQGAGEVHAFEAALSGLVAKEAYPIALRQAAPEMFRELGKRYEREMSAESIIGARFTDKLLGNFLYCGVIHLALPGARIIHTRRDPVETCMSCFSKLFLGHHPYAYNLPELGRYYRAYESLMDHWRSVLPHGVMIDVDYQAVVEDTERESRRIIEHCGLQWESRCLNFHKLERPVRTASAAQVRKPIYRTSIGRWRAIEDLLEPLIAELRERRS